MPTYAYACKDCGHAFETVQSFSDDSLTECPQCEGKLRKKFSSVGVVFKGSGFYRNDSRSTSSSTAPAASTDAAASTSGGDAKSSGAGSSTPASSSTGTSSTGSEKVAAAAK